jgi:hypothetical protein
MRQVDPSTYPDEIVHPTCVRCGAPMWLTRIEPETLGSETHTFECQACGNSASQSVKLARPA